MKKFNPREVQNLAYSAKVFAQSSGHHGLVNTKHPPKKPGMSPLYFARGW
jgi:hypothetical protein